MIAAVNITYIKRFIFFSIIFIFMIYNIKQNHVEYDIQSTYILCFTISI